MTLDQLYQLAESKGIEVDDVPMKALRAVAFPEGWIAMDRRKFKSDTEYKCVLAHEIGHILTRSFYSTHTRMSVREASEHRANRFAAELLVPIDELLKQVRRGISLNQLLAQLFEVTIEFIDMVMLLFEGEILTAMRAFFTMRRIPRYEGNGYDETGNRVDTNPAVGQLCVGC